MAWHSTRASGRSRKSCARRGHGSPTDQFCGIGQKRRVKSNPCNAHTQHRSSGVLHEYPKMVSTRYPVEAWLSVVGWVQSWREAHYTWLWNSRRYHRANIHSMVTSSWSIVANRYVVKQGHTALNFVQTDVSQAVLPCLVNCLRLPGYLRQSAKEHHSERKVFGWERQ